MAKHQFKIDLGWSMNRPFALCFGKPGWFGRIRWERIESFETMAEAEAAYEKIRALPKYLVPTDQG